MIHWHHHINEELHDFATLTDQQFLLSVKESRPSYPVSHHGSLIAKTIFEHCVTYAEVASIALASKSIQNSSIGANFASNIVIDEKSVVLFKTVFHPLGSVGMQFVSKLHLKFSHQVTKLASFIHAMKATKHFHASLKALTIEEGSLMYFLGNVHRYPDSPNYENHSKQNSEGDVELSEAPVAMGETSDRHPAFPLKRTGSFVVAIPRSHHNEVDVQHKSHQKFTNLEKIQVINPTARFTSRDVLAINSTLPNLKSFEFKQNELPWTRSSTKLTVQDVKKVLCLDKLSALSLCFHHHFDGAASGDFSHLLDRAMMPLCRPQHLSILELRQHPSDEPLPISDEILMRIGQSFKELNILRLGNCSGPITAVGIKKLLHPINYYFIDSSSSSAENGNIGSQLEELSLVKCGLTDDGLQHISTICQNLLKLDLSDNEGITDVGIELLISTSSSSSCESLAKLTFLSLAKCNIKNCSLERISKLPNLTELNLSRCDRIDFDSCAVTFPNVIFLHLKSCQHNVTDASLTNICSVMFPKLRLLSLKHNHQITDVGLKTLTSSSLSKSLQFLKLTHLAKITDQGLISLVKDCKFLVALNLFGCSRVTDYFLRESVARLRNFAYLNVDACEKISMETGSDIQQQCPRLVMIPDFASMRRRFLRDSKFLGVILLLIAVTVVFFAFFVFGK